MLRWPIAVAVTVAFGAGVVGHGTALSAPSEDATSTGRSSEVAPGKRASSRDASKASSKRAKSTRSKRYRSRSRRASNMPRGFTWPPSRAMARAEAACVRALDAAAVMWKPAAREGRIAAAVTIEDGKLGGISYVSVYRKGPHKLDCQLALALHTIGPALHAAGVREVRFGSIYRWSQVRVGGKTRNALSRHALGLAMDVVAFVDEAGREASVARDYSIGDSLLLEVERAINASNRFRVVLTPSNDPISHDDHFHIEASPTYATPYSRPLRKS
jgi:hypothetical protein